MGVKDDPYSTAQAAILLTYRNTKGDQLANSAWLRVAIRYTRAAKNSHLIQIKSHEHRASFDLKRLWWCCIVRDRLISIGVRRPLQIMDTIFDSEQGCLSLKEIQHETTSEVYDTEAKSLMCKIFISQCQLAAVLTLPATVLYDMNLAKEYQASDLEKCQSAKEALEDWREDFMKNENVTKSAIHHSVLLDFRLTLLYYQ
ncbi:FarB protein [Penicillium malachiteum]|uniref:FarB protein n=1 Tax=Penicillium malachiteum TaxID=1324776 RepID=A0AAD6HTX7_9EURO|nr:FarB protein [Penicillium malachiteum]